jgi:hypothetical protein
VAANPKPVFMILKALNLVMFGFMILMNYLANAIPLNNKTTGELSDQYPNLFVPAGITFSIWGIIYLLLLVFVILQFREENRQMVQTIGWAFALSCLLNGLWIVAWHYEQLPVSLLIMIGLLVLLIFIGMKLQPFSQGLSKAAFGVYLGWICIAIIANVTALLVHYNWGAWGISEQTWTIIMIAAGLGLTAAAVVRMQNPFVGLAVIWAFAGIVIKRMGNNTPIVMAALIAILLMTIVVTWLFIHNPSTVKVSKI